MKKIIFIALAAISLAGCNQQEYIKVNKAIVLSPPKQYFNCPQTSLPNQFTSNADVARILAQLFHDNRTCGNNMNVIQNWYNKASATIK